MLSAVVLSEVMATDTPVMLELAVQTGVLPQVPLKLIVQVLPEVPPQGTIIALLLPAIALAVLPQPEAIVGTVPEPCMARLWSPSTRIVSPISIWLAAGGRHLGRRIADDDVAAAGCNAVGFADDDVAVAGDRIARLPTDQRVVGAGCDHIARHVAQCCVIVSGALDLEER